MDEMVAAVDALSREALSRLVTSLLGSLPALAVGTTMSALGPLRGLLLPVPTPFESSPGGAWLPFTDLD